MNEKIKKTKEAEQSQKHRNGDNDLGNDPIPRLLFRLAFPTLLAQLVNLLYSVVDRMYVGRIPGAGSMALAGLGVTFPITMFIAAFASLVGAGGGPRSSIAMGRGDHQGAEKILGNCVTLIVVLAAALSAIFSIFKRPVLKAFGASEQTLPYAESYISIYLAGTLFVMVALGLNLFITNQGFAKTSMATVCIGAVCNIILDPIFIFGFDMGVRGAAVATVISQGISALWVAAFLLGKRSKLRTRISNLKLDVKVVLSILSLGMSPFVMSATECLLQLTFNRGMRTYGNDMYVALMSILFSITQIIWLPVSGFSQGAQPLIGFNYGAGKYDRVKHAFKLLFGLCVSFQLIMALAAEAMPQLFIGMFTNNQELISMGIMPLRIFIFGMALMGAQSACQQTFIALGEAKISMFLAVLRKIILLIPLALLLPKIGGLGVWGLFLAEPISDILAAVTTTSMFYWRSKKILS